MAQPPATVEHQSFLGPRGYDNRLKELLIDMTEIEGLTRSGSLVEMVPLGLQHPATVSVDQHLP
jgi:hypothetical protein